MYARGTNSLNVRHNKAMAHSTYEPDDPIPREIPGHTRVQGSVHGYEKGLWWARPKIKKMWRWCEGSTQGKGVHQAYKCPAQKAIDKIEEEHHEIPFLYKANKTKYGKLI